MGEFRGVMFGVVPILLTPFDESGELDEASLRNEVDFVLDAGAHGLGIALGSEIYTFTEAERDRVTSIVVDQVRDRAPVVVNTGAVSTNLAVHYSLRAYELGAAALMCTPPLGGFPLSEVIGYYTAISDAVPLPIVIQDTPTTPVPAASIRAIAEVCEQVTYAKVESVPAAIQVHKAVREAGDVVEVFGGAGGGQFLAELRRGSIGTMPFPTTPGAFAEVWDRWRAGDAPGAQEVFDTRIAPLLSIQVSALGGYHRAHKEALRRQGVIRTAFVRPPAEPLDAMTLEELDAVFDRMGW